tara:strand:+ start:382 stop:630 length:249 start_codon:yes stop_codon:yes gene_type:complete
MKSSPIRLKQKLSPSAAKKKAVRDLAMANSPARKAMRAENQRLRRSAIKKGIDLAGKDYDHTKNKFVSVEANRGGHGKGTKK